MNKATLKAEVRKITGRKVKSLRRTGVLPGNVYGKKIKSQSIQLDLAEFKKVFVLTGETNLLELVVGSDKKPVLVHNIQKDPVTDTYLHVDFLQVDLKAKVTAQIPLELVGESPAVKQGLGTVVLYLNEIEVEALPADLPDKFELDTSTLTEVDQQIAVKDLKVDTQKVEIKADPEEILVKVEPLREEEPIAEPLTEELAEEGVQPEEGAVEAPEEKTEENTQSE